MIHQIVSKKKKKSYSFYFYLRTNSTSCTRARLLLHSPFLLRSKTRHNQFHNDSSVVLNHTLDLHSRLKKSRCFNIISLFLVLNVSFSLAFNQTNVIFSLTGVGSQRKELNNKLKGGHVCILFGLQSDLFVATGLWPLEL